jgi:hypothetical protein
MITPLLPSGDELSSNMPNNSSSDTLPYMSPIAMRSQTQNDSYATEPIIITQTITCNKVMSYVTYFHITYVILSLVLSIIALIINSIYGDDMKCNSGNLVQTIGLKSWLNVFGAFGIINIVIYIVSVFLLCNGSGYSLYMIYSGVGLLVNYTIFSIFRSAWIIIGCVLFWKDCLGNSQSPEMNSLISATLLISVFFEHFVVIEMVYNGYKIYTCAKRRESPSGSDFVAFATLT